MTHGTHQLIGVSAALAGASVAHADPVQTAGLTIAAFYGSWLPDADQFGSRVHRRGRLERSSVLIGAVGLLLRLPLLLIAAVSSHRGVSHSLVACAGVAALFGLAASLIHPLAGLIVGAGVALGYGAHVVADACTPGGVVAWAPFSRRRVWALPRAMRMRTGGMPERAVAAVAAAAGAAFTLAALA